MKNYLIYIAIIIFIFLNSCSDLNDGLSGKFTIKDTTEISKIIIENNKEKTILEKNNNNKWLVNSKFIARNQAIENLLLISNHIKIKNPVTKILHDSLNNELNKKGKIIKFYDKDNDLIKSWIIGNFDKNSGATYIKIENSNKIYTAHVPGISKNLNKKLRTKELFWLTRTIFNYKYYQIKEIKVIYPDSLEISFHLKIDEKKVELYSLKTKELLPNINLKAVGRYLTYFENIKFETFLPEMTKAEKDSMQAKTKHIITVTGKNNIIKTLKTYEKYNKFGKDIHKINANINENSEFVTLKYYNIDLILKELNYFIITK